MHLSIVLFAVLGLAVAIPATPEFREQNESVTKKQQDVVYLLENILGRMPNERLYEIGKNYHLLENLNKYQNPSTVKYYAGLVKTENIQPHDTLFSLTVDTLRKEAALLIQILIGAKDYETFLNTAAWARVHVNVHQYVKAFASAVINREDMRGVVIPPVYEIFPHYFFHSQIIEKVHNYVHKLDENREEAKIKHLWVNESSEHHHYGEDKIAYFTEDIGLSAYYAYIQMSSYFMPPEQTDSKEKHRPGHGSRYYYLHQQLLARYNLERLGQSLGPVEALDDSYQRIETPYNPHLRHPNGDSLPTRDEHIHIPPKHHNHELVKHVHTSEHRIVQAIQAGYVITPQAKVVSLYQPEGIDILGEIIEGTGHSVNPRYYGAFAHAAKKLLGNAPKYNNIYEYSPSVLELGFTAVRDPIFYQLYSKIMEFFNTYQEALPAYQYNDVVVAGVKIEKVDVSELKTYFSDYEVDVSNVIPQSAGRQYPTLMAHVQRLNNKPYEYTMHIKAEKYVPGAVVRVFVGPKYNYNGEPVDINKHRHYFYELDQFAYDLAEGDNTIVRNSHKATGQSNDWPSVHKIKEHIENAMRSKDPYNVTNPQDVFGFPSRLTLPKGTKDGLPLQFFFIVSGGLNHQDLHYGPVVEEKLMSFQPQHYQVVGTEEYKQYQHYPTDTITGTKQTVEVVPNFENPIITKGDSQYGNLYKKHSASEGVEQEHTVNKQRMQKVASGFKTHEDYLQGYYMRNHIGNIIGGAVSLDGMPFGYPFDRQLAQSVLYAPNIYIKDVVVYHRDE